MQKTRGRNPQNGLYAASSEEKSFGKRLRCLFKKSPSGTSLPESLATDDDSHQPKASQPRSASATGVPTRLSISPEPASGAPVNHLVVPVGAPTAKSQPVEPHIWRLAFDDFKTANPELSQRCSALFDDQVNQKGQTQTDFHPPDHATLAFERIQALQADRAALHQTSAKFRKVFEDTVALVMRAKDAIALATTVNPCASAAFAAVGLLLPLFLASTEENEKALNGLNLVAVLITEYRWKEKSYLSADSAADFCDAVRKIYVAIYELEAELYDHLQHNKLRRLGDNIYNAGRWNEKIEQLNVLDSNCKKLTDAIAEARAVQWKSDEQRWQETLLSQPRLEAEKANRRHLYCAYENAKNVNPIRTRGTLEWFLGHPKFLGWRASQSCEFLWLVHDPGCGKSVLSKCLVDQKADLCTINTEPPLVCYYFFREQESTLTSAATAVKSCLHQLLIQKPGLYKYMARDFEEKSIDFLDDFEALWSIFIAICRDPEIKEMVFILDALDQCQASRDVSKNQRKALARRLAQLYETLRDSPDDQSDIVRKFFVTSRPEIEVEREFRSITMLDSNIRFNGDEQIILLRREVDIVVAQQLKVLAQKMQLRAAVREQLGIRLAAMEHRSYLWVKLVFEFLEDKVEITAKNVPRLLAEMPQSINQAYANLLSNVRDPTRTKLLLQYVLAATNPLSLSDLNVLMNIDENCTSIDDIELWPQAAVESNIRSISGLLVTIVDFHVHFIHHTVRAFLSRHLVNSMRSYSTTHEIDAWTHTLDLQGSALALMQACITFLSLDFKNKRSTERIYLRRGGQPHVGSADVTLFPYASCQWIRHFVTAAPTITRDISIHIAKKLFDPSRIVFKLWLGEWVRSENSRRYRPRDGNGLMWAAFFGLDSVVSALLPEVADINTIDSYGRSALFFAVGCGNAAVVERLLQHGAAPNAKDWALQTPLTLAVQKRYYEIGKMLLDAGSTPENVDIFGRTILSYSDKQAIQSLGLEAPREKEKSAQNIVIQINAEPGTDFAPILKDMETYILRQHGNKTWQSSSEDVLLRNMKTLKSTGLSTLFDSIVLAVELLEREDGIDHSSEAHDYTMTALGAIPTMIETESPLLLCYIPRILAYLWSHKHIRLACTITSHLADHSTQTLGSTHPLTCMLSQTSQLLLNQGPSLDVYSLARAIFDTLTSTWSKFLGLSHAQVIYVTHVSHIVQAWFNDPATLIPTLTSLADTAVAVHGPTSYAALQIRVDLAQIHLSALDFNTAKLIALDICEQVLASFTPPPPPPTQSYLSAPTSQQTNQPHSLPQNLRMIHLFLEALRTSAEANFRIGHVDDAEAEYREVLVTSSTLLGVMHSRTRQHRRSLAQFLRRMGKDAEADEVAYSY